MRSQRKRDAEFEKWLADFCEATGYVPGEVQDNDWLITVAFDQGMQAEWRLARRMTGKRRDR